MARVLVVDDDEAIRALVGQLLREEGYDAREAEGGGAALERLAAADWRPDLILLDLRMPDLDGEAFARRYQAAPGPHAPVVLFTATSAGDAASVAAHVRVAGVLVKPFDLDELLAVVRQSLAVPPP